MGVGENVERRANTEFLSLRKKQAKRQLQVLEEKQNRHLAGGRERESERHFSAGDESSSAYLYVNQFILYHSLPS